MKKNIFLFLLCFFVLSTSCEKEKIILYNTQLTPDLSDPLIQKISNVTWYRDGGVTAIQEEWITLRNISKPSETMASMLYAMAWTSIRFNRDGTTSMQFEPPIFSRTYIHCQGTWMVSKEEKHTVIVNTKTPVSSVIIKIKVLNLEAKDNVAKLILSMDFGNRLITAYMSNDISDPSVKAGNENWYENHSISTSALNSSDFMGAWASPNYDSKNFSYDKYPDENRVRSTHVDDLFSATPNLFFGIKFSFEEEGKAHIIYAKLFGEIFKTDKEIVSEGSWYIKGNKLILETDEELFYSAGEAVFGFPIHAPALTLWGVREQTKIRTQAGRFYVLEVIKRETHGFWCRITTNDANFYTFLFHTDKPLVQNFVKVKDLATLN